MSVEAPNFDSAIMLVNPSNAYKVISVLPKEMIQYELETQGIKSDPNLNKSRSLLANVFKNKTYRRNKQPVAMGFAEDYFRCRSYYDDWAESMDGKVMSVGEITQMMTRFRFLMRRLEDMPTPCEDQKSREALKDLQKRVNQSITTLLVKNLTSKSPNHTLPHSVENVSNLDDVENWIVTAIESEREDEGSTNFSVLHNNPLLTEIIRCFKRLIVHKNPC